jgi:hypothetical protein
VLLLARSHCLTSYCNFGWATSCQFAGTQVETFVKLMLVPGVVLVVWPFTWCTVVVLATSS